MLIVSDALREGDDRSDPTGEIFGISTVIGAITPPAPAV